MPTKFQFEVRLTKTGKSKYLSHREFLTLVEQAVRRSGIPILFSEGFNPRPKISFLTALSLGISSDDEVIILSLSGWISPVEILQKLNQQLIDGIKTFSVEPCRQGIPAHFVVQYKIIPTSELSKEGFKQLSHERIKNWFASPSQIIRRDYPDKQSKDINIKTYLQSIELRREGEDNHLLLNIKIGSDGSVRPEEVLLSLGLSGERPCGSHYNIHKLKTFI
ncbi:MAG: TIGR03936 family radical SAM-associated protein [Planctomycetota bacterium]|nr:TIGR03936 family radical SAM-associated protein [Planctomycetota bacterium]MDI6786805.1 TIGR03936 family radical SAM-associated protein [Planctomycetota bacterium]